MQALKMVSFTTAFSEFQNCQIFIDILQSLRIQNHNCLCACFSDTLVSPEPYCSPLTGKISDMLSQASDCSAVECLFQVCKKNRKHSLNSLI
jgi:hypothetical protein